MTSGLERRVAELYDFSLDIARYDGDIEFARGGGTIHYVLDENIFELFVNPFENFSYVLRDEEARRVVTGRPTRREIIAMQSALLTGEALLSGTLPGQKGQPYLITEWHRWEFLERVSTLLGKVDRIEPDALKASMEAALAAKGELIGADESGPWDWSADPYLGEDLVQLENEFGAGDAAALRFARVRKAAAILAQDTRSEPVQQLNRVLTMDAAGRLVDIKRLAAPRANEDREAVKQATREWETVIHREAAARAARFHKQQTKTAGAIKNDAQSLALIDWVSRTVDPKEDRVVFVTGDPTLFDAYRRVYEADRDKLKSGADPFFMRRPLQYSALFSMSEGDIDSRKRLFYSLQQMVELPLTPIRVASVTGQEASEDIMFRRHSLTLPRLAPAADRTSYFHEVWRRYGNQYEASRVDRIETQIETAERMLNGLSGSLVERRILEADRKLLREARGLGLADRARMISAYVDRAVESFISAAVDLWRPEAESFFRRVGRGDRFGPRRTIPLSIQLTSTNSAGRSDLGQLLDSISEDPVEEGSTGLNRTFMLNSSFEIFIGAGALALHANQWRLGDHFCEVAINAFRYFAKYENITEREAAEAHYLCALAKRFRMAEIMPSENISPYSSATKLFEKALELLRASESLAGTVGTGFQSYRSYAERSALCMFYSVLCAAIAAGLEGLEEAAHIRAAGVRAFRDSGACLAEALRVERRSGFDIKPKLYGTHIERVRLQVLVNVAAWYALAPEFAPGWDRQDYPELARECARNLSSLEQIVDSVGYPLFTLELMAFKISQGIDSGASWRRVAALQHRSHTGSVELDRTMFDVIKTHWASRVPQEEGLPQVLHSS